MVRASGSNILLWIIKYQYLKILIVMNLQKNYFNIMKPQCRSRANIQSLRRRMFIFYEILGLIMKILVSHENLSGFPQMRKSWNPWTWASGANWRYNPRLSFYLASPGSPSFFYWESHSNSWVELTSSHCSLVMPGYSFTPALVKEGQVGTSAVALSAVSLKSEEAPGASFVHAFSSVSERDKFQLNSSL